MLESGLWIGFARKHLSVRRAEKRMVDSCHIDGDSYQRPVSHSNHISALLVLVIDEDCHYADTSRTYHLDLTV